MAIYWQGKPTPAPRKPVTHAVRSEDLVEVTEYGFETLRWEVRCTCRTKHTFVARLRTEAIAKWAAHAGVVNVTSADMKIGAEALTS